MIRRILNWFWKRYEPSPMLDVRCAGDRWENFRVTGAIGFALVGVNQHGRRLISREAALDPDHWRRLWRWHNRGQKLTWEGGDKVDF